MLPNLIKGHLTTEARDPELQNLLVTPFRFPLTIDVQVVYSGSEWENGEPSSNYIYLRTNDYVFGNV